MKKFFAKINIFSKMRLSWKIMFIGLLPLILASYEMVTNQLALQELLRGAYQSYASARLRNYTSQMLSSEQAYLKHAKYNLYQKAIELEDIDIDELQVQADSIEEASDGIIARLSEDKKNDSVVKQLQNNTSVLLEEMELIFDEFEDLSIEELDEKIISLEEKFNEFGTLIKEVVSFQEQLAVEVYTFAEDSKERSLTLAYMMMFMLVCLLGFTSAIAYFTGKKSGTLIDNIQGDQGHLKESSVQLDMLAKQLTESSSQQATAMQESVAAMEEMDAMAQSSMDFANSSLKSAENAANNSNAGLSTLDELTDAIRNIEQSNGDLKEINEIVNKISKKAHVINDIVLKTQLLSINASIEAERAGEYGKGFSVVAEEVGKLAESSGKAADEIGDLIEDSVSKVKGIVDSTGQKVETGKQVVSSVVKSFESIVDEIKTVTENTRDIAKAIEEQKGGIDQTTSAMKEMDESSKQVREVALDTSELSNQIMFRSNKLSQVVFDFTDLIKGKSSKQSSNHQSSTSIPEGNKKVEDAQSDKKDESLADDEQLRDLSSEVAKIPSKGGNKSKKKISSDDESFKKKAS